MTEIAPDSPIDRWLTAVAANAASDLHLGAGRAPMMRLGGQLVPIEDQLLSAEESEAICRALIPAHRLSEFEDEGTADFAISHGGDRYRLSVFRQRGTVALVARRIPQNRMSFEEIGAPAVLKALAHLPRGLILVTGPTGSGKTTTLAALLHEVNTSRACHIVTLEDPIEFYHDSKQAIVTQREIGDDVVNFSEALRRALRQDPDVIMLGEMRDLETTSAAISAAETGHLVMGTMHTTGAARTVDRIVDQYPQEQQEQIRSQVAVSLQAVVSQVLVPRADGRGRVAAFEVMIRNSAIENHIRKGETFKIPSVMQTQRRVGMQLLDEHLLVMVKDGTITREVALEFSQFPAELRQRLDG